MAEGAGAAIDVTGREVSDRRGRIQAWDTFVCVLVEGGKERGHDDDEEGESRGAEKAAKVVTRIIQKTAREEDGILLDVIGGSLGVGQGKGVH
jgi:hypothetical protein